MTLSYKWFIRAIVERYLDVAEQILKPRTIYCAFWGYLKRCSWSLSCWEKIKARMRNGSF